MDAARPPPGPSPQHEVPTMSYEVDLEVFSGPFDLLLELIARRKLDVTEVDLAEITADYLASLDGLDRLDLETATRFLVVAATLVELKAARLLPSDDLEDEHDLLAQARDLLYARLLEYRAFRDVARSLASRFERHRGHRARDVELEARFRRLVPDVQLEISVEDLARVAARATAPRDDGHVRLDHIRRTFLSIRDAADIVLRRVGEVGAAATFDELVAGRARSEAVVVFLAALELYKLGQVDLHQPDHRATMTVARTEVDVDLGVLRALSEDDDAATDAPRDDEPGTEAAAAAVQPGVVTLAGDRTAGEAASDEAPDESPDESPVEVAS